MEEITCQIYGWGGIHGQTVDIKSPKVKWTILTKYNLEVGFQTKSFQLKLEEKQEVWGRVEIGISTASFSDKSLF